MQRSSEELPLPHTLLMREQQRGCLLISRLNMLNNCNKKYVVDNFHYNYYYILGDFC